MYIVTVDKAKVSKWLRGSPNYRVVWLLEVENALPHKIIRVLEENVLHVGRTDRSVGVWYIKNLEEKAKQLNDSVAQLDRARAF